MKRTLNKGKGGFTLIELLIVIAIIGILAAIAIPNFLNMRAKGQVAACASSLGGIKTAQEMFMTDWDVYAASLQNLNNYSPAGQNRVYIDQAKVDANCNTPLTSTTATGWYANAVPKGKFGGAGFVCNLRYWESGNNTTGKCG